MAKTIETIINRFDGGIQNDPRLRIQGASRVCKNFDVFTNRHKAIPFLGIESGDSNASTYKPRNFAVALDATVAEGTAYKLYTLGIKSGDTVANVRYKNIDCCAATDLGGSSWSTLGTTAKHEGSASDVAFGLFTYWGKTGLIYCATTADNQIMTYDPDGLADFAESGVNAVTMTTVSEGLVHSKDDKLYIPYDNSIMSTADGTTWNDTAITIPSHMVINSICEYGNYIAIAGTPKSGIGKTFVYLWNRDSSLTTVSESIEWGTGQIKVLEEVEGFLVGISYYGGTVRREKDRAIFRAYAGGTPQTFLTLQTDISTLDIPSGKQKIDERLLFQMQYEKDSAIHGGIYSISLRNGRFALVQESFADGSSQVEITLDGTYFAQKGFIKVGDTIFQSYINDSGSTYVMSKTDDQTNYAYPSIFQTNINPNMSAQYMSTKKQLVAISLSYDSLPTDGSAKLEYRVDGGSWVEIFTETTDSAIITEAKIDVNGATFAEGREYEFRVTSKGGAVITELKYKTELMGTII